MNPDLVARDEQGKPYTVRYEAVNAMLLNEFLKEHRTVQEQQKEIDALKAELKEQKSLIQKVSAQLDLSKPARHGGSLFHAASRSITAADAPVYHFCHCHVESKRGRISRIWKRQLSH